LVDRGKLDATAMGIDIIATLHTLWPREFQMQKAQTLSVNADAMKSLADGVEPSSISAAWQPAVWAFAQHTVTYHLY
jgi:hypothetical protein